MALNRRNFVSSLGTNSEARRILALIVVAIVLLAAFPILRMVAWSGDTQVHTIVETVSTLSAFMVGVIALMRHHSRKDTAFLLLGIGFAGTALLDGYHTAVTSEAFAEMFPSVPSSLIPWSWNASRLFLSVLMSLSWLAWLQERKPGQRRFIRERTVYVSVIALTILSFLFFAFVPLPRAYYSELPFPRPEEFVAAFFFLLALVGYLKKGAWRRDTFEFWVVLSLLIGVISQALYMSFSAELFDTLFMSAHFLTIVSYLCVLTGLLTSMYSLFRQADENAHILFKNNEELRNQVILREQSEDVQRELSRENDALAEIGRIVNSSLDIEEVFERTVQQVRKLIPFDRIAITLVDSEKRTFHTPFLSGDVAQRREATASKLLPGSATEAIMLTRSGILANSEEMAQLVKRFPSINKGVDQALRSLIAVPLISNDDAFGSLNLRSCDPDAYTENEMRLAQRIAAQIAGAIANSQLHAKLEQEAYESEALAEIGRIIGSSLKIDQIYERFAEETRKLLPFDRISIVLLNSDSRVFTVAYLLGENLEGRQVGNTYEAAEDLVAGYKSGHATATWSEDVQSLPDPEVASKLGLMSALHAPLVFNEDLIGLLVLRSKQIDAYREPQVQLAERVANQVAGAIAIRRTVEQLDDAQTELSARNNDLETLLHVTSHDLREPLRAIENFLQIVKDRYADRIDEKGRDYLRRVVRGAQRMNQLLEDILTLSRAQRMERPSEWIASEVIVREVLQRLETTIEQTNAEIHVADSLPSLRVDKVWATQAVYNLVSNALKFTRDGEHPRIEIDAYYDPGDESEAGLVVRDRGPGIDSKHVERVFKLFQRAVGREIEGTGAGLAIVSRIAERHGGRAGMMPREGGGSEIFITFGPSERKET